MPAPHDDSSDQHERRKAAECLACGTPMRAESVSGGGVSNICGACIVAAFTQDPEPASAADAARRALGEAIIRAALNG